VIETEEFVTHDGTDHSAVEQRIELVLQQRDIRRVELHFEKATETCNILPTHEVRNPPAGNEDG
jgi:uncharacterized protein YheU (UPF0270 family)